MSGLWHLITIIDCADYVDGNKSASSSFWVGVNFSGNFISNAISKSPFRDGSLGNGKP